MAELQPHPHRGIFRRHPHEVARPSTTPEAQGTTNTSVSEPIIDGTLVYPPAPLKQPGRVSGRTAAVALGSLITAGAVGLGTLYGVIQSRNGDSPTSSTTTTENSGGVAGTPPPTSIEGGAIAITPTTVPKTPEATPTPSISPMETALKTGMIELKDSGDWEKYFTIVTPEEAESMINNANSNATSREQYRMLLPFDPRTSPHLVLEEFINPSTGSRKLGIDGLNPGTSISAPLNGTEDVVTGVGAGSKLGIYTVTDSLGNSASVSFHTDSLDPVTNTNGKKVGMGTTLTHLNQNPISAPIYGPTPYQGMITLSFHERIATSVSMSNLLQKDGKIAFIAAQQK